MVGAFNIGIGIIFCRIGVIIFIVTVCQVLAFYGFIAGIGHIAEMIASEELDGHA